MADNAQSVLRRLRELYNNPRLSAEQILDNIQNFNKGRRAEVSDRGAGYRALTPDERRQQIIGGALENIGGGGMGGLGVIKNKGGNWLTGSVENALRSLKSSEYVTPPILHEGVEIVPGINDAVAQRGTALNNWIEKNLTKYVKNEMATPQDPVSAMLEQFPKKKEAALTQLRQQIEHATKKRDLAQAERGFTPEMMTQANADIRELEKRLALEDARQGIHIADQAPYLPTANAAFLRVSHAPNINPEASAEDILHAQEGMAISDLAKNWENRADSVLDAESVGTYLDPDAYLHKHREPWMENVPASDRESTAVFRAKGPYSKLDRPDSIAEDLGFSHLIDELQNAINPESGLPKELLLDHANIGKMTVPQMVEHVDKINAYRSVQKAQADAMRANNAATRLHKEYPENNPLGLRWVELRPSEELNPAYELKKIQGKNGEYFDLRKPGAPYGHTTYTEREALMASNREALQDALKYEGDTMGHCVGRYCNDILSGRSRIFSLRDAKGQPHVTIETMPGIGAEGQLPEDIIDSIVQIKGKANRAPNPEYLPFVQDFVKSGKWSKVGDLYNTGLQKLGNQYLTAEEIAALNKPQEFKHGGLVEADDDFAYPGMF